MSGKGMGLALEQTACRVPALRAKVICGRTFALCLALFAFPHLLPAADHYVCDCASGADPQCMSGSDSASGYDLTSPWQSYARARDAWAGLAAGDSISFCRGGVFPVSGSAHWVNGDCEAGNRCVIGAYDPPWAEGNAPRPRIQQTSGHGFAFVNFGGPAHEEGVVLQDLEIVCTGCGEGDWGVFLYNDIDDLRMQGLHIHGFSIGVHLAGSNACDEPGCDRRNERIELLSSDVTDNQTQGWLGADDGALIADNRFLRNGTGGVFQHNLYLAGTSSGIRVLRNELYRSAALASGSCEGGSFAVHGVHDDLLIEGNVVHEDAGAATPACWGIAVTPAYAAPEAFTATVIRGNRVRNMGNLGIGVASCVDCVIENNIVENFQSFGGIGILAPAVGRQADDAVMQRLIVRNNSVHLAASDSGGIRVGGEGEGHLVVSNVLRSEADSGSWACFGYGMPAAAYDAIDHNICGFAAGAGREWAQGGGSLAEWQTASGFDLASMAADPGFAAAGPPAYDLRAAAADSAMVAAGHPALSSTLEFGGQPRGGPPDAGAYQFGVQAEVFGDGFEK